MSDQSTNAKMLDYIETTGEALAVSEKLAQAEIARQEKVASIVPQAIDKLVEAKLVTVDEKQAAADMLSTHEGALNVIENLADYVRKQSIKHASEIQEQGVGVTDSSARPTASNDSLYVGRRRGNDEQSPAWAAFEARLGV